MGNKKTVKLEVGDLYIFMDSQARMLTFDDHEVMYRTINDDYSWCHKKAKTITYYRCPRFTFEERAKFIKHLELTQEDISIHRPDLPLRINCFENTFWPNTEIKTNSEYDE